MVECIKFADAFELKYVALSSVFYYFYVLLFERLLFMLLDANCIRTWYE